jgi:hypothetical protein
MIGSPIEAATWEGAEGAYYTGLGSGELIWVLAALLLCVVALVAGSRHEKEAYRRLKR